MNRIFYYYIMNFLEIEIFSKTKTKQKKTQKKTNPEILVFSSTSLQCPVTFFTVILNAHALFQQNKSITI